MSEKRVSGNPDEEALIKGYYEASLEAGHWLMRKELKHYPLLTGIYSNTCACYVGGLKRARQLAAERYGELKVKSEGVYVPRMSYSDKELLRMYFDASERSGHWLDITEIGALASLPSVRTYERRIGGLDVLRMEAYKLCVTEDRPTRLPMPETLAKREEKIM